MTLGLRHATLTSELAGGRVSSGEWDAEHDLTMATARILGRVTASDGAAEELTAAQVKTLLAITAGDLSGFATIATSGSASDLSTGTVAAARMPALIGDATSSAGAVALTLATVNSNVGSFGSATQVAQITVNAKGLVTAAANVTITPAVGSISGLGTGVATALAVNVGSAGAFVTFNGAGGTPSSLTLTNATGLPIAGLTASTVTALGVGSIELGHASDTSITRVSAGNIAVEGNAIYRAGGTDVPVADGGTGSSTAAGAATNLGLGTGDSPQFTAVNIGHASDTTITRTGAGDIAIEGNAVYRAGGTDVPLTDGGTGASSASAARTNLGLGTSAVIDTGTSGTKVALLDGVNSWSGAQTFLNSSGIKILDTDASHSLGIIGGSNLTAARTLTLTTGDASRTLDISAASVTISTAGAALIDDADASAQRTTLGLGTSATVNTGTSGATIPLLNAANTWSATQTFDGAIHWVNALIVRDSGGNPYIQFTGTAGANCGFFRATTSQVQLDAAVGGAVNLSVNTSAIAVFSASLIDCTVPIVSNNSIKSNSATAGVGYATGAGGTVTQATSKSTGVTLNKVSGQITMHNASLAATTSVAFTLTNSAIAATDTLSLNIASGATSGAYVFGVQAVAAGSCSIFIRNVTAGALGEAVVFNFNVIKGVAA